MNNYEILIKTLPFILEKYCQDSSSLLVQNIIRTDVLRIISETSTKLVNLLNLSEDIDYLSYVIGLIKEINQLDEISQRQFLSQVFFRLTDQLKDLINKNEDKGYSRIAVQKEKIAVFGYFDYFVTEKQTDNVNWIYFTQFSDFFGKLVFLIEEENLDSGLEKETESTLKTILEIFLKDLKDFLDGESHLKLENPEEFCSSLAETLENLDVLNRFQLQLQIDFFRDILKKLIFSFAKKFIEDSKKTFFDSVLKKSDLFLLKSLFESVFSFKASILANLKIDEEQNLLEFVFFFIKKFVTHLDEKLDYFIEKNQKFVSQLKIPY